MLRRFMNAKIRDIRLTGTHLEYEGSITLDEDWLDATGIAPNEEVQVLNVETGARFTTYVILGERGSGVVELNGPAAHLGKVGDRVMVLTYAHLHAEEIPEHEPVVLCVNPEGEG
jgi:aspartate 1-decarboxylase